MRLSKREVDLILSWYDKAYEGSGYTPNKDEKALRRKLEAKHDKSFEELIEDVIK